VVMHHLDLTSLRARFGLAWFEQTRSAAGEISFVEHQIMGDYNTKNPGNVTFRTPLANAADMDGDGIPDIVVGKRYWSHEESYVDPDPMGARAAYLPHRAQCEGPGGAEFVPELVHNRSGAGSTIRVADLHKDGAMDILTAGKLGTFGSSGRRGPAPEDAARLQRHQQRADRDGRKTGPQTSLPGAAGTVSAGAEPRARAAADAACSATSGRCSDCPCESRTSQNLRARSRMKDDVRSPVASSVRVPCRVMGGLLWFRSRHHSREARWAPAIERRPS
jgi:hypothetical protein